MSKIETEVVNDIRLLSLEMIKSASSGNSLLAMSSASVFYSLFMDYLKYDNHNDNWVNKDRLIVSNSLLPAYYASLNLFGFNLPLDSLKDYKKLSDIVPGYQIYSDVPGDVIGYATGISLGERYLSELVKKEDSKSKIIDFKTFCLCTWKDIVSGIAFESLLYASKEKLNKLVIVVIKDKKEDSNSIQNYLENLKIDVINAKSNSLSSISEALEEAVNNNIPTVILVDAYTDKDMKNNDYNRVLTNDELDSFKRKYKLPNSFEIPEEHYKNVDKNISKRLGKDLEKWQSLRNNLSNGKIKNIIDFLETKDFNIGYNVDNLKINDSYEEELYLGNNKIFNILAGKSPFILNVTNNNSLLIKSSKMMSKNEPTERNIYFEGILSLNTIALGLALLGFKVFVSSPLILSSLIKPFIKYGASKELDIHYNFTHDTFLNTFDEMGISAIDEINSLRLIPKLITFRPADINEIIGVYNIIANYKKCTINIIGSNVTPKLEGTNPKYVVAGAYRVKRERGEANGIIIATGSEVNLALKIADELLPYGIDLRVVTIPCLELFINQSERYQYTLLPKELKTFVIEFGSTSMWSKYATSDEYIFGLDRYSTSGTKEELLNKYNLDKDSIKAKIVELMKN